MPDKPAVNRATGRTKPTVINMTGISDNEVDYDPKDIEKGRDHQEPFRQTIFNYRACLACGYVEREKPIEKKQNDSTGVQDPIPLTPCPVCGSRLHRLSALELVYYGFAEPNEVPVQIEILPEPESTIGKDGKVAHPKGDVEVPTVDVYTGGKDKKALSFAYASPIGRTAEGVQDFRKRLAATLERSSVFAVRMLVEQCVLVMEDGCVPRFGYRAGAFGREAGALTERIGALHPVCLSEIRQHSVRFVNDNNHVLTVEIDKHQFGFVPRAGFPQDTQVSPTAFEDFVRRFKNLREDAGRAVAFLLGCGCVVEAVNHPDSVVLHPSSRQAFLDLVRKALSEDRDWSGDVEGLVLEGEETALLEWARKVDAGVKVLKEDTASSDIPAANVVFAKRFPVYREFTKKIMAGLGGYAVEFGMNPQRKPTIKVKDLEQKLSEEVVSELMASVGDATPKIERQDGYMFVQSSLSLEHLPHSVSDRKKMYEQVVVHVSPRRLNE